MRAVVLFSPHFHGTWETWTWICSVSNGRWLEPPALTNEQRDYAINSGYLLER